MVQYQKFFNHFNIKRFLSKTAKKDGLVLTLHNKAL